MISIKDKYFCCGCEACVQTCPRHCISFEEDTEGFRYPSVDEMTCIECGLCETVCPVLHQAEEKAPLNVYAAQNTNEDELLSSSSGGMFILLAKSVLQQGGVVFGAKFDNHWNVKHDYAESVEDVKAFMGSKYVQSRVGNTYRQTHDFLEAGRKVLYSGTPCQIAGLKHYLRNDYDNLLTVDVICHGVPSPKVWRRYLDEIKQDARKGENSVSSPHTHFISGGDALGTSDDVRIESISFRDKRTGWKKFSFALTLAKATADGKKNTVSLSHIFQEDPYMKLFLSNLTLRPSCYQCPAKGGKSQSDITIADYWGIEKVHPDIDDNRGVSLLMVNSEKGMQYIDITSMWLEMVSFADATACNPVYLHSVAEPPKRMQSIRILNSYDESFGKITKVLLCAPFSVRIKRIIKRFFTRIVLNHKS